MRQHCPEAVTMRKLRKSYGVGVEFTNFPTRPMPKPRAGAQPPDQRWLPVDMLGGQCTGRCEAAPPPVVERTVIGKYAKWRK